MKNANRAFAATIIALQTMATAALGVEPTKSLAFPPTLRIDEVSLALNGSGLRTATIFGFKIYEAAFYTPNPVREAEVAQGAPFPKVLDFRFLRAVDDEDVRKAWIFQIKESAQHAYPTLDSDVAQLVAPMTALKKNQIVRFVIRENSVQASTEGRDLVTVPGPDFRRAFLSVFFGSRPPTPELKTGLLGPAVSESPSTIRSQP